MYYNGDILTMEGDSAAYVEAILVKDGKIAFAGSKEEAMKRAGENHVMVDLEDKTLVPGFIDAHGHASLAGLQAVAANLLPAPDGPVSSIADVISAMKEWEKNNQAIIDKYQIIIGFGYDDAQLKEKLPPTADDLDKISTTLPVIVIHQSGHLAVVNHKVLELVGYTKGVKDPPGGVIRRKKGTDEPNGVLEEMASIIPIAKFYATLDTVANIGLAKAGIDAYLKFGFTTIQEGRAAAATVDTWKLLASRNEIPVDLAAYPDLVSQMDYMHTVGTQKNYTNHFRVAGVKLSLDGSVQGKTAWLTQPYLVPPPGQPRSYKGYPAIESDKAVDALVDSAFANNWQLITHCNGDAAADQFIGAVRQAANLYGNNDRRSVMIHAQAIRYDQLDSMKALGIIPSFFSMHTYYWGDWHRDETLGKERAYKISPTATALNKNMLFTEHHDAPVALPSSIMILYTTVNRASRSGDIIGSNERVSPYVALESITKWAAYQYFEENTKGTLTAGKLADMVVLDKNPLKIEPGAIKDIQILETIKEGKTVYKK